MDAIDEDENIKLLSQTTFSGVRDVENPNWVKITKIHLDRYSDVITEEAPKYVCINHPDFGKVIG